MGTASFVQPERDVFTSRGSFDATLQHWAAARIDSPMQLVARFDEAAKQLIVLGGVLQGLFFAVGASTFMKDKWLGALIPVPILLLIAMVFCAAKVICVVPVQMEAINTYRLMRRVADPAGVEHSELMTAMEAWCTGVDRVAADKHKWLRRANWLFLFSSLSTMLLLFALFSVSGFRG